MTSPWILSDWTPTPGAVVDTQNVYSTDPKIGVVCHVVMADQSGVYSKDRRGFAHLIVAAPEMLTALREMIAADDAMLAFLLAADAEEIGEEEWARQHKARAERKHKATAAALAAISKAEAQA